MRLDRRTFVTGASAGLVAATFRSGLAAGSVMAWHDRTAADHRKDYAQAVKSGLGLTSFSLYGERKDPLCAAVLMPRAAGVNEEHRVSFGPYEWLTLVSEMAAKNLFPSIVTATGPASDPVMAAVFRSMTTPSLAQINLTGADLDKHNAEAQKRGTHVLSWLDCYGDGADERFIAVWTPDSMHNGWRCGPRNEEALDFQKRYGVLAPLGARLTELTVTPSGKTVPVLVEQGGEPMIWRGGLTSAEYQQEFDAAGRKGLLPLRVHAKGSGTGARFAAVFATREQPEARTFRSDGPATVPAIDAHMETYLKANGLHGAGLAIVDRTRLVYAKGYTFAPPDYPDVKATTLFQQASVSKVFVALALYQLMQERPSITLDSKLYALLNLKAPGGKPPADPRFADLTLRQVIESTSSIDNGIIWNSVKAAEAARTPLPAKPDQLASWGLSLPLTGPPGDPKNVRYSNAGYFYLSRVIAHQRNAPTFVQALAPLLKPLDMTRVRTSPSAFTAWPADEARRHIFGLPTSQSIITPDRALVPSQYGGSDNAIHEGSGGLSVAVTDIARIAALLASRDNNPVLRPATLDALLDNAATATKTLTGPDAHGYHGFDYVRKIDGPPVSYRGGKGGYIQGNQSAIIFNTTGFSYVIAINGNHLAGAIDDWEKRVRSVAEKHPWPAEDLFPKFGMKSFG